MKILRKLVKVDKIIKKIERERQKEEQEVLPTSQKNKETSTQQDQATFFKKISILTTFKQIWYLLGGIRRKIPSIFFLMLFNSFIGLFSISLIIPFVLLLQNVSYISSTVDISQFSIYKRLVIQFSRYIYDLLNLSDPNLLIVFFGVAFIIIFLIRSFVGVYVQYKITIYSAQAVRHFSSKIFSVLLYISYTYFLGRAAARTMYAMGLAEKNYGVIVGMFSTLNDLLLMGIVGLGIVFWTPSIIVMGVLVFIISLTVYRFCHHELKQLGQLQLEIERKNAKNVYQGIHNFTFSRLFHVEPFFLRLFHGLTNYNIPINAYKQIISSLPRLTIETLLIFGFVGYSIYVIVFSKGVAEDIMTTAAVLAAALLKLMPASLRLTGYLGTLAGDQISVDEFYTEYTTALQHTVDAGEHETAKRLSFEKEISIKRISFAYPVFDNKGINYTYDNSPLIIKNISLTIKKGEKIGIIGGSGGGKTTFMHILMAFLSPKPGTIEVDGVDIHQEMRRWHKNIGYVPQETMLMSGTILDNIAFGVDSQKMDQKNVIQALKSAHLWNVVKKLPRGIFTDIGDSGKRFSGGQRQRLGIARALYRRPNVIFFDEATSHLDQQTEREVQKAIDELGRDITVIIVAHRLNTLEKCDRIYCIEKGRLAFEGTYKQMIKKYG